MGKIININQLAEIKKRGKKIVLVGGCFDLFHIGHLRFLESSRNTGTVLVVLLESDETVKRLKGSDRPIHTQAERAEILSHLDLIDFVVILPPKMIDPDYLAIIKTVKPEIISVTEYDPIINKKQLQADLVSAKLIIVSKSKTPSTSKIANILIREQI